MEMSHRSKEYEAINTRAEANFKRLIGVGDGYRVLFVQGGASGQFATVPMNFLPAGGHGRLPRHRHLGREGDRGGRPLRQGPPGRLDQGGQLPPGPRRRPRSSSADGSAYVHLTSNETIQGVQFRDFPDVGGRPAGGRHEQRHPLPAHRRRQVRPDLRRGPEEPRAVGRDGRPDPRVVDREGQQGRADDAPVLDPRQEQLAVQHPADVRRLRPRPGPPVDRRPAAAWPGSPSGTRRRPRPSTTPSTAAAATTRATPSPARGPR